MSWGDAWVLHCLWALLPLAGLLLILDRRREKRLRLLLDGEAVARLAPGRRRARARARVKITLWLLACALAIVALARPQWGSRWHAARQRGLDLLVVLDTSNSMRATDLKPSRMLRAKLGIGDLPGLLDGDRIGLVAFAGSSFLQCPLTTDYAAFSMILDDVSPGVIPRGGTDVAQALETALESFGEGTGSDRAIILVTDGEDHEGHVDRAIGALKDKGVRVFAIGVGSVEGGRIPAAEGEKGPFLTDRSGNIVTTALREQLLEKIAAATGGIYARAAADDFGLDRIFSQGIATLKRDEKESRLVRTREERFPWFLGAALLLLSLEAVLGDRQRQRGRWDLVRRGLLIALVFPAVPGLIAPPAAAADARRAMREGAALLAARGFEEAAAKFAEAEAGAVAEGLDPAAARYNRGRALALGGKTPESVAAFTEASHSPDPVLREKAHFNLGVALASVAETLESAGETGKALQLLDLALGAYESAMLLDPRDEDPKVNHELVTRMRARLERKRREQGAQEPEETRALLEAMRQQETSQRARLQSVHGEPAPADKNW